MGARDRVPRGKNGFDQLKTMVREAEEAEYLTTNENKEFTGTPVDFLMAVYRCEALPVKIRLYAAKEAANYQPKGEIQADSVTGAVVFLPCNGRDPVFEQANFEKNAEFVTEQLQRLHKQHVFETDTEIRRWIEAGRTTEEQALLYRPFWTDDGDPAWEPVQKPGHSTDTAPLRFLENGGNPRENGADATVYKSVAPEMSQPNGEVDSVNAWNGKAGLVVLFTSPFRNFQVGGHRYASDGNGEVFVDEFEVNDIAALERSGCSRKRR
jgi:hypothetical protein